MQKVFPVDPVVLATYDGELAAYASHGDTYFEHEPQDSPLGLALDELVEELPELERVCVELYVFGGKSYGEISRDLGWGDGTPSDGGRKKAWRVTKRGLARLRKRIEEQRLLDLAGRSDAPETHDSRVFSS